MKEEFIIRPYNKGDEASINHNFNRVFNLNRPIEEWNWKFDPDGYGSCIMIAVDENNKVFAHYAATLVDIRVNGQVYKCGQPVDVYSVKQTGSVQSRLYIKTVREFFKAFGAKDKIQLLFGFPSARVLKLGQIKLDYGEPVPVVVGRKKVKHRRFFFKRIPKFSHCNQDAVEELWKRSCHRYPVSVVRDASYIKKRYLDRPHNKYFYLTIEDGEELRVFSVFEYNKSAIKWIDLIWDGCYIENLIAMDKLVEKVTRLAGVGYNEMWIANDQEAKDIFIKRGWTFTLHDDLFLVAMSFNPELKSNRFIKDFYFTMGDSDLV
jgi:hypothetical protein